MINRQHQIEAAVILFADALSHRVLLESHSRRHVRSGYMFRRNWSARVIGGRSRGDCGRAWRSEPWSMGAVVAGRPTSILHLPP